MSLSLDVKRFAAPLGHVPYRVKMPALPLGWRDVAFVAAHIPLALLIKQFPEVATLHAGGALVVGLYWATSKSCMRQVAQMGAYITAAEVLWRMAGAYVPWEFGKYAVALILMIAILRNFCWRLPVPLLFYFALLLPAIIPTAMQDYFTLDDVRQAVSFNLSGPLALMVSAWFFSNLRLTNGQLDKLFVYVIGPTTGIAVITLFSTATEHITWGTHSNLAASGGYGPNQVSSALGLGALITLLLLLRNRGSVGMRFLIFGVMMFLAMQSALTFSRGGLFGAAGAALVAVFFSARDRQVRMKVLFVTVMTVLIANFLVLPSLDNLTGGALTSRFEELDTTGRTEIVLSDLSIWSDNPIFGAGVGMSLFRKDGWRMAHTEFTRLLAEHGIFGLTAIGLLLTVVGLRLLKARLPQQKALSGAMFTWSFLFMLDKAMRLVAPSFFFGLAFAVVLSDDEPKTGARRGMIKG